MRKLLKAFPCFDRRRLRFVRIFFARATAHVERRGVELPNDTLAATLFGVARGTAVHQHAITHRAFRALQRVCGESPLRSPPSPDGIQDVREAYALRREKIIDPKRLDLHDDTLDDPHLLQLA